MKNIEINGRDYSGIVAFTGTHGTGKTDSVLEAGRLYKRHYRNKTVTVLMENAAYSPYPINQETTLESQMWIFTNHIQNELAALAKHDIVIADRTALDAVAYTHVQGYTELAKAMFKLFECHKQHYSRVIYKTIENNDYLVADGLRDTDISFRLKVENTLMFLYGEAKMEVEYI